MNILDFFENIIDITKKTLYNIIGGANMIELFRVKNFMSFKDESVLDFRALSYKQHKDHIILSEKTNSDAKYGHLKTIAIYGANAAGKSNLIAAIHAFQIVLSNQLFSNSNKSNSPYENITPFLLSDSEDNTEFEIVFNYKGNRYQYGFELKHNNISDDDYADGYSDYDVINEWYYINDDQIYDREKDTLSIGTKYKNILNRIDRIPSGRLFISALDYFLGSKERDLLVEGFREFIFGDLTVYFELIMETSVKTTLSQASINSRLFIDQNYKNRVEEYLKMIDVGIERIEVKEQLVSNGNPLNSKKIIEIKTIHKKFDEKGNAIGEISFDLNQESSGTLRFLMFIQRIIEIQEKGGVLIIDELSARLHPLLTKLIINMFQSSENTKSQLIFSTHDISLLNKEQFRRDEIVFVDKNERGESKIYTLADLKVREDSSFYKEYIQGKYGAIPIFRSFDELQQGDESNA